MYDNKYILGNESECSYTMYKIENNIGSNSNGTDKQTKQPLQSTITIEENSPKGIHVIDEPDDVNDSSRRTVAEEPKQSETSSTTTSDNSPSILLFLVLKIL
jgi:hypothetical protein